MTDDVSQATYLQKLSLEVDDKFFGEIKPGEISTIRIANAMQFRERRTLRLLATVSPNLKEGTQFPIHLRFLLDGQLINGYTHEVRVAPLSDVVTQVLDSLYGALRDVAVGFKVEQAQVIADAVKDIVLTLSKISSPGCIGLLLRVFRRQGFWKSAVANQAKYITDLAQNIITRNEPELQSVGRHLLELGMLLSKSQKMDDANFIESIRDQADRIQEIAGRIIRQSLKP